MFQFLTLKLKELKSLRGQEATITSWLKAVGDKIEEDEPIVEIAT